MIKRGQKLFLVMTMALIGFASNSQAAPASPAAPATAKGKNSAEELSKTMLPQEQYEQMIGQIVQTGSAMAQAKIEQEKLKADPAKEAAKIEKSLKSTFTYKYFIDLNMKTMKKNFDDAELKSILDFYDTPIGKKWIKFTPQIIGETMESVQKDLREKLPKLVDAIGGKPTKTSSK
jgi:hypothetical protein